MDFVFGGGGGVSSSGGGVGSTNAINGATSNGGLSHENGPILYSEPNRTSAIDDIRSVVIYIFIITIFLSFFLILPGIRTEKFPTFLCITTSLLVTSILLISLFGTSWHVGQAPISAAYKAFSRDRIQGELNVKIGLQSVNITLKAHKYYILHATDGPIIMDNSPIQAAGSSSSSIMSMFMSPSSSVTPTPQSVRDQSSSSDEGKASSFINQPAAATGDNSLTEELIDGASRTADDELEVDEEAFDSSSKAPSRWTRSSSSSSASDKSEVRRRSTATGQNAKTTSKSKRTTRRQQEQQASGAGAEAIDQEGPLASSAAKPKFTIKRVNVDINYNERFYWIEPNQMRQEYHNALERGLPYPILTVVEYLSQDDAGFNWSRQYRAAGYYSSILLWLSVCVCILMFCLHCAAPKYGIYAMQILGCLLLFTDLTYFTLVPKGEQRLVIPFEGQSLEFGFGWQFWLVFYGGCLSFGVGTCIVIYDKIYPNYIFTTVLDVDFDSQHKYYKTRKVLNGQAPRRAITDGSKIHFQQQQQPTLPPFFKDSISKASSSSVSLSSGSQSPMSTTMRSKAAPQDHSSGDDDDEEENYTSNEQHTNNNTNSKSDNQQALDAMEKSSSSLRRTATATSSQSRVSDASDGNSKYFHKPDTILDENHFKTSNPRHPNQFRNLVLNSPLDDHHHQHPIYHKQTSESPLSEVRSSVVSFPFGMDDGGGGGGNGEGANVAAGGEQLQHHKSAIMSKRRSHHHSKNLKNVDHNARMIHQQNNNNKTTTGGDDHNQDVRL